MDAGGPEERSVRRRRRLESRFRLGGSLTACASSSAAAAAKVRCVCVGNVEA